MARFANSVLFLPASGGTTDFIVSSAVQGYMTPALAGAVTGVYKYRAESADLSQWEIGEGTYTSGTTTLTRTTVLYNSAGTGTATGQSGAGSKINFSAPPRVGIVQAVQDTLEIENTGSFTATQRAQARTNINAVLKGQLFGLTLSAAGTTATFGIAAGEAADSTAVDLMVLASAYTKTTSAWAVGTGNGAMDTSTVAASTWYYVHLIKRPDTGVVDVLFSLSPTAPTLPTNYTLFRRIGAMFSNAASQWGKFRQIGDDFLWAVPQNDQGNVDPGIAGATYSLASVPPGITIKADIDFSLFHTAIAGIACYIDSPLTDQNSSSVSFAYTLATGNASVAVALRLGLWTANGQFSAKTNTSTPNSRLAATVFGWTDPRGRT